MRSELQSELVPAARSQSSGMAFELQSRLRGIGVGLSIAAWSSLKGETSTSGPDPKSSITASAGRLPESKRMAPGAKFPSPRFRRRVNAP